MSRRDSAEYWDDEWTEHGAKLLRPRMTEAELAARREKSKARGERVLETLRSTPYASVLSLKPPAAP